VQQSKRQNAPGAKNSLFLRAQGVARLPGVTRAQNSVTIRATPPQGRGTLCAKADPRIDDREFRLMICAKQSQFRHGSQGLAWGHPCETNPICLTPTGGTTGGQLLLALGINVRNEPNSAGRGPGGRNVQNEPNLEGKSCETNPISAVAAVGSPQYSGISIIPPFQSDADCAKQTQTWAGRGIWGTADQAGQFCETKPIPSRIAGAGAGSIVRNKANSPGSRDAAPNRARRSQFPHGWRRPGLARRWVRPPGPSPAKNLVSQ
jgi:hypothetical protein